MSITNLVRRLSKQRIKTIEGFMVAPEETQALQLKQLLKLAENTKIGEQYDFKSIRNVASFQERVNIHDYEDLKPAIQEMITGKKDILWPGMIKWFAQSSGTTNDKSKYIPVSKEALKHCHYQGGKDTISIYLNQNQKSKLFSGKGLTLGGSCKLSPISKTYKTYTGDLSAILINNIPWYADLARTPNKQVALLGEWEDKIKQITSVVLKQNITNFSGVPSWLLILLRHILASSGANNLLEIWPNLELFLHGGINFQPYKETYHQLIPVDSMNYLEIYNASEGFFALQDDMTQQGMLLMLDYGVFFEFIPMSEFHSKNPRVLSIGEVEENVNYALLITTNSGLWRYLIGDTVSFTSTYPHRIIITGRTKHFINAFGEELMIANAEKALNFACQETGARLNEYTAAPVFMDKDNKGKHQWLLEFETAPDSVELFTTLLDKKLQEVNSDYEAKRYKNLTLDSPLVTILPPGTFIQWMKKRGKLGGQNKIPRLSNDRKHVDQILALLADSSNS